MSRLSVGDLAPTFRVADVFGTPVDLDALRGSRVFLSFFRNAACAICNLRVSQLITRHDELSQAGVTVIGVFESSADAIREHVGRQGAPFPIVADPDAHLYELFGVECSEDGVATTMELPGTPVVVAEAAAAGFPLVEEAGSNFLRMPADFLIDADGIVLNAHYAEYVWDHTPLSWVMERASAGTATC
jgi:peroxiredoxin